MIILWMKLFFYPRSLVCVGAIWLQPQANINIWYTSLLVSIQRPIPMLLGRESSLCLVEYFYLDSFRKIPTAPLQSIFSIFLSLYLSFQTCSTYFSNKLPTVLYCSLYSPYLLTGEFFLNGGHTASSVLPTVPGPVLVI